MRSFFFVSAPTRCIVCACARFSTFGQLFLVLFYGWKCFSLWCASFLHIITISSPLNIFSALSYNYSWSFSQFYSPLCALERHYKCFMPFSCLWKISCKCAQFLRLRTSSMYFQRMRMFFWVCETTPRLFCGWKYFYRWCTCFQPIIVIFTLLNVL
jgi:hypothetical protein